MASPHQWKRGEKVLYFSDTANDWIETTVVGIFHDAVQVECKPGLWIPPVDQPFKLRTVAAGAAPPPQVASPQGKGPAPAPAQAPRAGSGTSPASGGEPATAPAPQSPGSEKSKGAKFKERSKKVADAGKDLLHQAMGMFKKSDTDANVEAYWSRDLCRPVDIKILPFVQHHVQSADPAGISSVNMAITRLQESALSAPSGLLLVYSASQEYWWLLFQSDKKDVAEATLRHAAMQRDLALKALEPELNRAGVHVGEGGVLHSPTGNPAMLGSVANNGLSPTKARPPAPTSPNGEVPNGSGVEAAPPKSPVKQVIL